MLGIITTIKNEFVVVTLVQFVGSKPWDIDQIHEANFTHRNPEFLCCGI